MGNEEEKNEDRRLEAMDGLIDFIKNKTTIEPPTDEEFQALTDWVKAEKDHLPYPMKEGLLKLVNLEARRRLR